MSEEDLTDKELAYGRVTREAAYEGASTSYRMGLKGLLSGEPDSLAARELSYLQMRSRHLVRDNGYGNSALQSYTSSLKSIKVNWVDKKGKRHDKMQELWNEFEANPNHDGYGTLSNTQALWHNSIFLDGNAFTRLLIKRKTNKNKVPLKLQAVPAPMHDTCYMGAGTNDGVRYGIRFRDDKPVSYFFAEDLYKRWVNEEAFSSSFKGVNQKEIPAEELIHLFKRTYPGQWLGIPDLAPVIITLYELDELIDATVAKQKAAQAIAWIVEQSNYVSPGPVGNPTLAKDKNKNDKVVFKASGGNVHYLNKGESIKFYQSTDIGQNLPLLIESELRKVTSVLPIAYHQLTGDTSGLNFSSIRAIGIDIRNRLEYIHQLLTIPLGLAKVTETFKTLAKLSYKVETAMPIYQLPRWYGIDELKDTQADLLEVQSGFDTLHNKLIERGVTPEEIQADQELKKSLGLSHLLSTENSSATKQSTNIKSNTNSSSN